MIKNLTAATRFLLNIAILSIYQVLRIQYYNYNTIIPPSNAGVIGRNM